MKKMMMIAVTVVFAAVLQVQAMNLDWSTQIIDDVGGAAAAAPGYVQLVWVGTGPISSGTASGGDGSVSGSITFHQGAIGTGTFDIPGGASMYFTVYNAYTIGAATRMITTSTFAMPTYGSAIDTAANAALSAALATSLDGGNGFIDNNDSRWVAVPEPTSMALLALGAAALGLRRKFRK